jgi:hypothetical protein
VYEDERDVAVAKAWANVDISSAQAMASLGELPETLHWMASLMKRMISIFRAFSSKKLLLRTSKFFRSGKSVIDAMSEMWLEFRYAIRPLIIDMDQAVKAWNAVLVKTDRFTARGFHRTKATSSSSYTMGNQIISRTEVLETNFRAGVLFNVSASVNELRSVWGLDKPIETIWELVPFSFMIDWFFSVGTTIAAWTANPGLNPLASWVTEEVIHTVTDSLNQVTPGSSIWDYEFSTVPGKTVTTMTYKRRIPSPNRPILPTFNLELNTAKLIDLAAIGRDLFRLIR